MSVISTLFEYPRFHAQSSSGAALVGAKLYTYEINTTTPKATYFDVGLASPHANPVVLDANGDAVIYIYGQYDFVLYDANDVLVWSMAGIGSSSTFLDYRIDALNDYGGGSSFTKAIIDTALAVIGSVNKTTLLLRPGTWVIGADADWSTYTNVTFEIPAGAVLQTAASKTTTLPIVNAGSYTIFTGSGTAVVNSYPQYREWWGESSRTDLAALNVSGTVNIGPYKVNLTLVSTVVVAGTDTYTLAASPAISSYVDGTIYFCKITNANTSATPTLNINSKGAKTIVKYGNSVLAAGNIPAGHNAIFRYDSGLDKMILLNPSYIHPNHSGDVTSTGDGATVIANGAVDEVMLASSIVSQGKLRTSIGEVSVATQDTPTNLTLPGGEYGFYPQIKSPAAGSTISAGITTVVKFALASYTTSIMLEHNGDDSAYAQQRYIAASGRDHWIFLLTNKVTGRIIAAYQAPDHPSANTQLTQEDIPHPFNSYNPTEHDIVIADNNVLTQLKQYISRRVGILELINQNCIIDDTKSASYEAREIRKINEWPDDPFPGNISSVVMETPQWAKIMIKSDVIALETFGVETLPSYILYRKLYFDKKGLK